MIQPYKIEEVKKLKAKLQDKKAIVLIDYKGINIEEVDELRNRMRKANVEYFVSKNTFLRIALNEIGITDLDQYLKGPTAIAACADDEVAPAREIAIFKKEVTKDKEFPSFKIGLINENLMDIEALQELAKLPGKEQLLSMVLQGFNAPITGFVGALNGILTKFVRTVDAIVEKQSEKN